jgi:hypothetical protein
VSPMARGKGLLMARNSIGLGRDDYGLPDVWQLCRTEHRLASLCRSAGVRHVVRNPCYTPRHGMGGAVEA